MAKINITRIFETSRALATKPGQELADLISYTAEAFSQIIAAVRNAMTFEDNFNCVVTEVTVPHNVPQLINTDGKFPRHIIVTRCYSLTFPLAAFAWQFSDTGQVQVLAKFDGAPTTSIKLTLVILF